MLPPAEISRRTFVGSLLAAPVVSRLGSVLSPSSRGHAVVVGAGAFGGWTALALLRQGLRVTLVDAWGAGHSRASSGGETRVIRGVYGGISLYSEMVARALLLWREAEQQWRRQVFFKTGALWLCGNDDAYVRRSIAPMKAMGLAVDELAISEAARRFPQMSFHDVRSAFFEPEAGYLTARVACELVRETFVREGGVYEQAWARPGISSGGRLASVRLSDGSDLEADLFAFACGPWMAQVFPDVVGRRIIPTRQEVFFFGTPAGDTRFHALPVWVHMGERVTYGVPSHEGRGLKIADDTAGAEVDPTTMEREPSAAGVARARAILRDRFPAMANAPLVEARVCQYEASTDGHFLIDAHPGLANVWLVGGGSGHGFKMGPALGEYAAALMLGRASAHSLFAHHRFGPL